VRLDELLGTREAIEFDARRGGSRARSTWERGWRPMTKRHAGERWVVFGATGNVGYGFAAAALAAGAEVLLPARSERSARELEARFAGEAARVLRADVSNGDEADRLREQVAAQGRIDHVVASLGAWWQGGRLVDQSGGTWDDVRRMLLDSQVHAARGLLGLLTEPSQSYLIVTGAGALSTRPAVSLLAIALGGTLALSRQLRAEYRSGARVNELRISARIEVEPRPGVVTSLDFARAVLPLFASDVRSRIVPFGSLEGFSIEHQVEA
jgi:NAD(P)-dependent dehydrogenase (short-subunit alcohol dehydrogenase family)